MSGPGLSSITLLSSIVQTGNKDKVLNIYAWNASDPFTYLCTSLSRVTERRVTDGTTRIPNIASVTDQILRR